MPKLRILLSFADLIFYKSFFFILKKKQDEFCLVENWLRFKDYGNPILDVNKNKEKTKRET